MQLLTVDLFEKLKFGQAVPSDCFQADIMQSASFHDRQSRSHYRHELRTLTYVILDGANGGIIRNLNHEGVAVQAVGALRAEQRIRLRFELRFPRLKVDAYGQVSWSSPSGQCGIRFVDLPGRTRHQINQWIFSNLLDIVGARADQSQPIFEASMVAIPGQENPSEENDGLTLSPTPRAALRLEPGFMPREDEEEERVLVLGREEYFDDPADEALGQLNWLSRPLSPRTLAWLVDGLVVIAGFLLFGLIFLSIAQELPQWPVTLSAAVAAAAFVSTAYWSLFAVLGGPSLGARLARATAGLEEKNESESADRFR